MLALTVRAAGRIDTLLSILKSNDPGYVFVVAHRGDWRHAPENSIGAIEKAAAMGVDMVEIDIQKTKDGNFILMHDGNIDRMTDGTGSVAAVYGFTAKLDTVRIVVMNLDLLETRSQAYLEQT